MIVADWYAVGTSKNSKKNTPPQGYITLSRVVNWKSFAALKPFTKFHAEKFKPSKTVLEEDLHLEGLCESFLASAEVRRMFQDEDYIGFKKPKEQGSPAPTDFLSQLRAKWLAIQNRHSASVSAIQKGLSKSHALPTSTSVPGLASLSIVNDQPGPASTGPPASMAEVAVLTDADLLESDMSNIDVSTSALSCLRNTSSGVGAWLDDCAIDLHLQMLTSQHVTSTVRFLTTQFYLQMTISIFHVHVSQGALTSLV